MGMILGKSESNSISFSRGNITSTATRDELGKIVVNIGNDDFEVSGVSAFSVFTLFGILALAKAFILIPLIKTGKLNEFWYLTLAIIYVVVTIVGIIVVRLEGGKAFLKNHGAEHMVIKAYLNLRKVPTIEEANCFNRIHKSCGVSLLGAFITVQLIGFCVFICTGCAIWEIILVIVPFLFFNNFPFNLLGKLFQFFITEKPDNENLELAIAAITVLDSYWYEPYFRGLHFERATSDSVKRRKTMFRI